jgi:hypothetical protein
MILFIRYDLNHEMTHKGLQPLMIYYRLTRWIFGDNYHPFAVENYREGYHPLIIFLMQIVNISHFVLQHSLLIMIIIIIRNLT